MSGMLPDQIDLHRAIAGGRSFAGEIALSEMPRLRSVVCEPAGQVRFAMVFERDSQGRATVRGTLEAVLKLECQRCLQPFGLPVSTAFALAAVTRPEQTDDLPEHYDPLLMEDRFVRPLELIEEELLLAVPLIPKHPSAHCGEGGSFGDEGSVDEPRPNPFAILAEWRSGRFH